MGVWDEGGKSWARPKPVADLSKSEGTVFENQKTLSKSEGEGSKTQKTLSKSEGQNPFPASPLTSPQKDLHICQRCKHIWSSDLHPKQCPKCRTRQWSKVLNAEELFPSRIINFNNDEDN